MNIFYNASIFATWKFFTLIGKISSERCSTWVKFLYAPPPESFKIEYIKTYTLKI